MKQVLLLILATSLCDIACALHPARTAGRQGIAGGAAADTLRGTVRIAGAEPATFVIIDAAAAGATVVAGQRRVLEQLAGIEVTVWGERRAERFEAARVAVRAVGGFAAVDGVLRRDDDGYVLLSVDGNQWAVPYLPPELRTQVGARIWLAGPLDQAPESYGVIR